LLPPSSPVRKQRLGNRTVLALSGELLVSIRSAAEQLEDSLTGILPPGSFQVQQRVKSLPSLFEKVWLRGKRADDLLALRVVLEDSPRDDWQISPSNRQHGRCLKVRGIAASLWDELAFTDYIAAPKPNGYCSLHVALALPSGRNVELQVRTRRMHEEAETGSAAHALYKQEAMHEAAVRGQWAAPGLAQVA
jgi:(p)ppGpp synthase/HD superfamily hydrolase